MMYSLSTGAVLYLQARGKTRSNLLLTPGNSTTGPPIVVANSCIDQWHFKKTKYTFRKSATGNGLG